MTEEIFGINPSKDFTLLDVREAIIECFVRAHSSALEEGREALSDISDKEFAEIKEMNVRQFVEKVFEETGVDFENPTKEGLVKVCDQLREFAANFRGQETISKNYNKIMSLINKLK